MIADILTVMWKEWREMMTLSGGRGKWSIVVFVGAFGIFMPFQMGAEWVQSPMSLAYWGWVPLLLVNSTIADAFAGERERHTLETLLASRLSDQAILLGKAGAAMAYGCGMTWVSVLAGLVTVNIAHGHGRLLMYSPRVGLGIIVFGILTAALGAGAGIIISLRASTVRQAQQTMGRMIMVLIFVPVLGVQALPSDWKVRLLQDVITIGPTRIIAGGVLALVAVDVALLMAASARFRRAKLILD